MKKGKPKIIQKRRNNLTLLRCIRKKIKTPGERKVKQNKKNTPKYIYREREMISRLTEVCVCIYKAVAD